MANFPLIIRDVLHGYISLDREDRNLLDCLIVQRLRYVRHNDVAFLVYPSLNTTRLEHSLGVFHIAGQLAEWALKNSNEKDNYLEELSRTVEPQPSNPEATFIRAARWYGLLHDIGHLPFSHLVESSLGPRISQLYKDTPFSKIHEAAGAFLLQNNNELKEALSKDPSVYWIVEKLLCNKSAELKILQPLKDIIDSDIDADRIDSTARDGLLSGGDFGNYDITRLIRCACLIKDEQKWRVYFTTKAISAIESILFERYKTYRWIHFHSKVVALKNAFRHCIEKLSLPLKVWHSNNYYCSDKGFLDDAFVLRAISETKPTSQDHANARDALLLRKKTAVPLWKRGDDFREISKSVAAGKEEWKTLDEKDKPILNHPMITKDIKRLEILLNHEERNDLYYLIFETKIDPFTLSPYSSPDKKISQYKIIKYHDKKPIPTLLTTESIFVQSLFSVVEKEPKIAVTVLTSKPNSVLDSAKNDFIDAARIALEVKG